MTVGYLGVGGTMALLLVVGSALLSSRRDGGLVFTVYVANFFGLGIATPTELLITRRYNVGRPGAAAAPRRALAIVVLVTAATVWVSVASSGTYHHIPEVGPAAALAVVGWGLLVSARSRLAGVGDLHAYAVVLILESAVRMVLLIAAVVVGSSGAVLLYAAAGVPLVCAALAAAVVHTTFTERPTDQLEDSTGTEQLSFIVVLLGYQGCLNLAPLLVSARTGSAAFGNANAYFRTPLVMLGGLYTHGLVDLSHAWGAGDLVRFRQSLRNALRRTVLLLGALTAATSVAAPLALRILYHSPHLPLPVYVALAVSGVLAGVAVVAGLALQASGHAGQAALAWLAAGVVTVSSFTASSGSDALAVAGLLAGPLIALVAITLAVRRLVRTMGTEG
jgi:hypothetical protein